MKYIAFFRGINVGGNHKVQMGDLKKLFITLGFSDVTTLLNSGNVLFSSDALEILDIKKQIETELTRIFGWKINAIVRLQKEIHEMVFENPFTSITVTPQTRLYVTFLADQPHITLQIPYENPEKSYKILEVSRSAVFSVLTLSEKYNTTDAMKILEKEFGKNVTTRNWNTIVKLAAL